MNVLILMGRGIEGTGQTRTTIEIHGYFKKKGHNVLTIANNEKKWGRQNAQVNEMIEHNFKKEAYELPKDMEPLDKIIICSVPGIKYSPEGMENFTQLLEKYKGKVQISYVQVDHSLMSVRRNYYALEEFKNRFFDSVDVIVTHSRENDFCVKFLQKQNNLFDNREYNIKEMMFISCDFDSIPKSKQEDKIDKLCYFIGRSATWKGWVVLKQMHYNHLKKLGYTTIIEGIELSINAASLIYSETKPKRLEKPDNIYKLHDAREPYFHKKNKPAYVFSYYNRLEALERLGKAKFGMFYTFVSVESGGPVENTLMEIIGTKTVPVIRKKFYDSGVYIGGRMNDSKPEDIGMVVYDEDNPQPCIDLMNKLDKDDKLYKQYVDRSYKWANKYFNRERVIGNFYKILEEQK